MSPFITFINVGHKFKFLLKMWCIFNTIDWVNSLLYHSINYYTLALDTSFQKWIESMIVIDNSPNRWAKCCDINAEICTTNSIRTLFNRDIRVCLRFPPKSYLPRYPFRPCPWWALDRHQSMVDIWLLNKNWIYYKKIVLILDSIWTYFWWVFEIVQFHQHRPHLRRVFFVPVFAEVRRSYSISYFSVVVSNTLSIDRSMRHPKRRYIQKWR